MTEGVSFKLPVFEGPLDLLLHLIAKNKVDICDVPIAEILDQYLAYLDEMKRMDLDIASDFIAMASQLMYIKSKMLLPRQEEEEEEDPRARLIETLLEYQRFKEISSDYLRPRSEIGRDMFVKSPEPLSKKKKVYDGQNSPQQLLNALLDLVERSGRTLPPPVSSFSGIVGREEAPVEDRVTSLIQLFRSQKRVRFLQFIGSARSRSELVASFLAVLELSKTHRILITDMEDDYLIELADGDQK